MRLFDGAAGTGPVQPHAMSGSGRIAPATALGPRSGVIAATIPVP
ncbi:hypothetical protein [Amycolatopsis sp. 195334CR]|nr:hypothetical protein [Amycolatopsis sp. 195334CR]